MPRTPRLLFLLGLLTLAPLCAEAYETRHVVIVAIDGARYSETLGDPTYTWCPRQGFDLAPLGAVVDSFANLGETITVPGMTALATGVWQALANDGSERPHLPAMFEYYRSGTGALASATWVVAGKSKLDVLAYSDHPDYGAAYGALAEVGDVSDLVTAFRVLDHLLTDRPALMLVNLSDTDRAGHSGVWTSYVAAIARADSIVYELWQAIEADPTLAGKTTLFITNDHGRHDDAHGGFQNHGDDCPGCRHIECLVLGPDTKKGYVSPVPYAQIDIPATAAELLGFEAPYMEGVVMEDLLEAPPVAVGEAPPIAGVLRIAAVHPNPASGSVSLALQAPVRGALRVDVLDVRGRRVRRLFDGLPSGEEIRLAWNGRDATGRAVPAGLYFVRALSERQSATARVVVLP